MAVTPTHPADMMMDDLGPLAWVLDEVRTSLDASSKALKRFARDVETARGKDLSHIDSSRVRLAKQQLRQVIGALEMVDLEKPARLLHSMEACVEGYILAPETCSDSAAETIEKAGFALTAYLEAMLAGRRWSAVALFSQYAEVQALAGHVRYHPADLWEGRWRWTAIAEPEGYGALTLEPALRQQMDMAMLQLMRNGKPEAAEQLKAISANISLGTELTAQQQNFWRLAAGLFEALATGALPLDSYVKRALTGILLQASAQLKDPQAVNVRLAHEILFFNAQARADGMALPLRAAVLAAYELEPQAAVDYSKKVFGHYDPAQLEQARKRIAAIKETWSLITAGESNKYNLVHDQLQAIGDSLTKLFPSGQDLAFALEQVGARIVRLNRPPETNVAMEVATSLLYVDAVLEDADLGNPELDSRTQHLAERLSSALQGGPVPPLAQWMEDLYRKVSDRQNMGSVVGELKISLAELEKNIDTFFRNTEDVSPLQDVPSGLAQMRGVLTLLGLDDAIKAVQWMRDPIESLHAGSLSVANAQSQGVFEKLGLNLGALGFLIDMLSYQPALAKKLFVFDAAASELRPLMGRSGHSKLPLADAAPTSIAQPGFDLTELPAELDFDLTQAPEWPESSATPLEEAAHRPALTAVSTPPVAVPATAAANASELDAELLNIFLEESQDVVANGQEAILALRSDPSNLADLTTVRRSYHTLKGSSRMVGLNNYGEAAWRMEQILNAWLADPKPATPELLDWSADNLQHFKGWAQHISATGEDGPYNAAAFIASAEAFQAQGHAPVLAFAALAEVAPPPALASEPTEVPASQGIDAQMSAEDEAEDVGQLTEFPSTQIDTKTVVPSTVVTELPDIEVVELNFGDGSDTGPDELPTFSEEDLELMSRLPELDEDEDNPLGVDDSQEAESFPPVDTPDAVPAPVPATTGFAAAAVALGLGATAVAASHADVDVAQMAADPEEPESAPVPTPEPEIAVNAEVAREAEVAVEQDAATSPVPEPALAPEDDDAVKVIGDLRVSLPLYQVFLAEADDWSRQLVTELGEWALQAQEPVPENSVALAHSLAGASGTVGHQSLSELARLLEHCLVREVSCGDPERSAQLAPAYLACAEEIRRILHQFAAGLMAHPRVEIADRLVASLNSDVEADGTPSARMHIEDLLSGEEDSAEPELPDAVSLAAEDTASVNLRVAPAAETVDRVDDNLFPIFEEEALELLPELGAALRQWHAAPNDGAARSSVLRILHTLKGSARLAGAMHLGQLSHDLETDIEVLGQDNLSAADIAPLLERHDQLQEDFEALAAQMHAAEPDLQALALPSDFASSSLQPPAVAELSPASEAEAAGEAVAAASPSLPPRKLYEVKAPDAASQPVRVRANTLEQLLNLTGEVSMARATLENELGEQLGNNLRDLDSNLERLREQLRELEIQAETQMQSRLELSKSAGQNFDPLEFDRFTRVQELTRMMAESVGDVATVQRNIRQVVHASESALNSQRRQTSELQRHLLRTRMVEFDSVAERLYRVVRQASKDTGKEVVLDISGGAIELDRSVLERVTPAFEHLLRNCVSHGIEDANWRMQAGKSPTGHIQIEVQQEGNDIAIAFSDDGRGLDRERILAKGIEKGLVSADANLSDGDILKLIYEPSFSTATEVTAVSGRGVGMDVVRSEVEALGGGITTSSISGQGSRFTLTLPLTTAVTQILMVRAGSILFALPANLVEVVRRLNAAELAEAYAAGSVAVAGENIPFQWAGALLQSSPASVEEVSRSTPVIIVRSAHQRIAVHVDEVLGNQEVVVKNLGPQLARLPGLAGMSILPSGAIVLAYNPVALHTVYRQRTADYIIQAQAQIAEEQAAEQQTPLVMVVDDSITVRRVTQRMLQREGYRVLLANDGQMALDILGPEQELPSIILSDIEMPRMDGFELLSQLRKDSRFSTTPIAMITSRTADKHREHALSLGANYYLGKPYSEDELLGIIAQHTHGAALDPVA